MKRYLSYKSSNIDWLGDIPEEWEIKRSKYLGNAIIGLTYSPNEVVKEGEGVLILRSSNIQNGQIVFSDNVYVKKDIPKKLVTKSGDILICSRNGSVKLIGKNALIDKNTEGLSFGAFMTIFRSQSNNFLYYFFNSNLFASQSGLFSTATINQLTTTILNNMQIPIPPYNTQRAIVEFLKKMTTQIDNLVIKKQKLIDLLNEEHTAIINQAVTKGINPDVEMKDSGIEWLGKIPVTWKTKKLKYLVALVNDQVEEENNTRKIAVENIESYTGRLINVENDSSFGDKGNYFEKGDILFNKLRPYLAKVYKATDKGISIGELLILRSLDDITSDFLYYRVLSEAFISEVNSSTYGTKMPRASWDFIRNLKIGLPSTPEQNAIAEYINRETNKIRKAINKIQKEIDLLQEYRTAIISEVVTGKIDVRDEVVPWT